MATETTKATFTPGPWHWKHDAIKFDKVQAADGSTVADLPGWGEVSDANARLIAAAPEMYEALRGLIRAAHGFSIYGDTPNWRGDLDDAQAAARAALDKANGR